MRIPVSLPAAVVLLASLVATAVPAAAVTFDPLSPSPSSDILTEAASAQLPFIENQGQIDNPLVNFYVQTFGGTVFVEAGGLLTYRLSGQEGTDAIIRESFSANPEIKPKGLQPSSAQVNSFKGNDPEKWKTGLPTYNVVAFDEIVSGIDLQLRAYGNNLEKCFLIQPGASPSTLSVRMSGSQGLSIDPQGKLEVATSLGPIAFTAPFAYQESAGQQRTVPAAYVLHDEQSYGFEVGDYDPTLPLTLDPLLAGTFIGGKADEAAHAIHLSADGNYIYIAGNTTSSDYPKG